MDVADTVCSHHYDDAIAVLGGGCGVAFVDRDNRVVHRQKTRASIPMKGTAVST